MLGIIPARAGFTGRSESVFCVSLDHPRSRGVYSSRGNRSDWVGGSSPLARGLRPPAGRTGPGPRIIPARAGFTSPLLLRSLLTWDHPRSRGVYLPDFCRGPVPGGSSPLARGLRPHSRRRPGSPGIIPARAGFTPGGGEPASARADHPRSRGVYLRRRLEAFRDVGSSPLARGLRPPGAGRVGGHRIIPARAGFTPGESR